MVDHVSSTLKTTGLDVEKFSITLAVRLFGQCLGRVQDLLLRDNLRQDLLRLLQKIQLNLGGFNTTHSIKDIASKIIVLLRLKMDVKSDATRVSALKFMLGHGGTMHLNRAGALVALRCSHCGGCYLFRITLLKPVSELHGVKAYRIPGLKCE